MQKLSFLRNTTTLALAASLCACGREPTASALETPAQPGCGPDGSLVAELYGGLRASLAWDAGELECEGMPRPDGKGARLRFSGPAGEDAARLALILGLPDLERGRTGSELPTNVTMIEEDEGRFFSNRDLSNCWTDVHEQTPAGDAKPELFRISGILYCVSPLSELNGQSSVTISDLEFDGVVDWREPE